MKEQLKKRLEQIKREKPLIHCITNHIAINDCANIVLALGAKPIMAEHPMECAEITACAQSLALNMGNISEARKVAMINSAREAKKREIPIVIDVAGVACSSMRREYAQDFIREYPPSVVKGNLAEIRALCGLSCSTKGVDSTEEESREKLCETAVHAAELFGGVVLISGKSDVISDGRWTAFVHNGSALLPLVTGTGCMLNVVCGTLLSVERPFDAAVMSAVVMGLAGEYSEERCGDSISAFHSGIIDGVYHSEGFTEKARFEIYE